MLEAGHRTNYSCLVVSGLVRGFYIDEEGNDRTKCFSLQGDWCCSYNYISDMPCPFFLEAEQDSVLAMFHIPEDPVTGSTHCMIAPLWGRLGKETLNCYQASERGGFMRITLREDRVLIAGKAVLFAVSELMTEK